MDPETQVAAATTALDTLRADAETLQDQIRDAGRNPDWSDAYRQAQVAELRGKLAATIEAARNTVAGHLDVADTSAQQVLAALRAPADTAAANAAMLATSRVQAGLSQLGPAALAEALADAGDVEALRALHVLTPIHVTSTVSNKGDRAAVLAELLGTIERRLEPLATPAEAAAIRARRTAAAERERLDTMLTYAQNPNPLGRMSLGFAALAGR